MSDNEGDFTLAYHVMNNLALIVRRWQADQTFTSETAVQEARTALVGINSKETSK